jgi:hypothetical protein
MAHDMATSQLLIAVVAAGLALTAALRSAWSP